MNGQKISAGADGRVARSPRVEAEMAAARRLRASGASEIDQVLGEVARRLADEVLQAPVSIPDQDPAAVPPSAAQEHRGDPGAQEEKAPVVVRVVRHRRASPA
jgi:hypothetical protein